MNKYYNKLKTAEERKAFFINNIIEIFIHIIFTNSHDYVIGRSIHISVAI